MDKNHDGVALVGRRAPDFRLLCTDIRQPQPHEVSLSDFNGRWLALLFYPHDFSFVCPTELTSFSARAADFAERGCEILAISVDSIEMHQEWLATPTDKGGLGPLQFSLASDTDGAVSKAYGVWFAEKEVASRGLFLIAPDGVLEYSICHNLSVGRNVDEVLRVLDALRAGGLCPASWTTADGMIDAEEALVAGSVLGHYRIERRVGDGKFGSVFAAKDLKLERRVALKVLKRKAHESREVLLSEARTAARLNHPNVCTIYAVEEEDGLPLIAMEFIDGSVLSDAIAAGISFDTNMRLAHQIAEGLALAHQENVVHGDLKPANIIVNQDQVAKILDFGLAKNRSAFTEGPVVEGPAATAAQATRQGSLDGTEAFVDLEVTAMLFGGKSASGIIRGTPIYMSPEQIRGSSASAASDVFAFGLTMFEMLVRRRALEVESLDELRAQLLSPQLRDQLVEQVDGTVQGILYDTLAHEASDRPPMRVVVDQLANRL